MSGIESDLGKYGMIRYLADGPRPKPEPKPDPKPKAEPVEGFLDIEAIELSYPTEAVTVTNEVDTASQELHPGVSVVVNPEAQEPTSQS